MYMLYIIVNQENADIDIDLLREVHTRDASFALHGPGPGPILPFLLLPTAYSLQYCVLYFFHFQCRLVLL